MVSFHLSKRSLRKLEGVHPDLVKLVKRAIELTEVDFAITEGVRTLERQRELYDSPKKVTSTMHSKHLVQSDSYGYAVDVMATGDLDGDGDVDAQDKARTWDRKFYGQINNAFSDASAELGIPYKWGGHFKGWFDGPHFEFRSA